MEIIILVFGKVLLKIFGYNKNFSKRHNKNKIKSENMKIN